MLVTHATRDGSWLLAESALTFGWLPARDVAYVDESAMAAMTTTRLAAVAQLINSAYGWAVMQQHWDLDGTEAGLAASEALTILLGLKPAGDTTPPDTTP